MKILKSLINEAGAAIYMDISVISFSEIVCATDSSMHRAAPLILLLRYPTHFPMQFPNVRESVAFEEKE